MKFIDPYQYFPLGSKDKPYRKHSFEDILQDEYRKASYNDNPFESVNKRLDILFDLLASLTSSQLDDEQKTLLAKSFGYEPEKE